MSKLSGCITLMNKIIPVHVKFLAYAALACAGGSSDMPKKKCFPPLDTPLKALFFFPFQRPLGAPRVRPRPFSRDILTGDVSSHVSASFVHWGHAVNTPLRSGLRRRSGEKTM